MTYLYIFKKYVILCRRIFTKIKLIDIINRATHTPNPNNKKSVNKKCISDTLEILITIDIKMVNVQDKEVNPYDNP